MAENTDGENVSNGAAGAAQTTPAVSNYKVLGQFAANDGAAVLGQNDATSGTPVGVEGVVGGSAGYGLYTPDDAKVVGSAEVGRISTADEFIADVDGDENVYVTGLGSSGEAGNVFLGHPANWLLSLSAESPVGATVSGGGKNNSSVTRPNIVYDDYGAVGGGIDNQVGDNDEDETTSQAATVAGGEGNTAQGAHATVAGGKNNTASADRATVVGGGSYVFSNILVPANTASGSGSFVGGGSDNTASGTASTVGGGSGNTAGGSTGGEDQDARQTICGGFDNSATAKGATVGGGNSNQADGSFATVPGGRDNRAQADYCFAAGRRAKSTSAGSFVWADSTDADFSSTGNDQFLVDAGGGVGIGTNSPSSDLDVSGTVSVSETGAQVYLSTGQRISPNTETTVPFDAVAADPRNEFDTSANTFSPDVAGDYRVSAQVLWEDPDGFDLSPNDKIETRIEKNGSFIAVDFAVTGGPLISTSVTKTAMNLAPSDTLSISVNHQYSDGGSDLDIRPTLDDTYAEFIRIG